jgi:CheY-like chemotaxis protein
MLRGPNETERLRPDLIMLNLNLPKRTGFELLEEMRKDGLVESIPVVVFSSSSLNSDKARCLALGAKGYFTKPGTLDEFVQTVQSLCGLFR